MSFIPEENLPYLTEHKYTTTGYSKFDDVMNHFWVAVVELLPRWLAPNLVTLIGLCFMIMSYVAMLFFDTTFLQPIPGPVLAFCAFCQFMYQTLDAVDGKQARRINQSSPLGMLLDHGCDSLSTTFIMLGLLQGLGLGLGYQSLALLTLVLTDFYLATWEEYHTQTCRTHIFNWGVTETQLTIITLLLITAVFGKDVWTLSLGVMTLRDLLVWLNIASLLLMATTVLTATFRKAPNKIKAILTLVPILMMDASLCMWFHNDLLSDYGALVLTLHGVIFSGVCDRLIISSVARLEFPWRQTEVTVPFIFLIQDWFGLLPRLPALYALCIFSTVQFITFVVQVTWQISSYLGISVFVIKPARD